MVKDKFYKKQEAINITEIYYKDGSNQTIENHEFCLDFIKKDYLKLEKVIFKKTSSNIEAVYPIEICTKWIDLLRNSNNGYYDYQITNNYHIITLDYSKYKTIFDLYLSMVLMRYLWYQYNDFLIYRTLDILNSGFCFGEALNLAHFYDNTNRSETFNIYNDTLIQPEIDIFSESSTLNHYDIQDSYKQRFFSLLANPVIYHDLQYIYTNGLKLFLIESDYKRDYNTILNFRRLLAHQEYKNYIEESNGLNINNRFDLIKLFYNNVFNKKVTFSDITNINQLNTGIIIKNSGQTINLDKNPIPEEIKKYYLTGVNSYKLLQYEN